MEERYNNLSQESKDIVDQHIIKGLDEVRGDTVGKDRADTNKVFMTTIESLLKRLYTNDEYYNEIIQRKGKNG